MTNREKHINNISNEEVAEFFFTNVHGRCNYCDYHCTSKCKHGGEGYTICVDGIKKWLERKAKITADEMFKELGYVKTKDTKEYKAYKKGRLYIDIFKYDMDKNAWAYIKSKRDPFDDMETTAPIHESEDKAIHKKLEELKNEKKYISQEN